MSEVAARMPVEVNLAGIMHDVRESEGLIVFVQQDPFGPIRSRFSFRRECQCWYVSIEGTEDSVSVTHIARAYEEICKVFGGNFEGRNGEHNP